MTTYRIGTSGWHYAHWRGVFYDPKSQPASWLQRYVEQFDCVELNNSFYKQPTQAAWESWRDQTPPEFTFAVKASRFITHIKRLKDAAEPVERLVTSASVLGPRLGPLLYQLPPNFKRKPENSERMAEFLATLPRDRRHVLEMRDKSWYVDDFFALLREHGVAFCIADTEHGTDPLEVTAPFAYLRLHGSEGMYTSSYSNEELKLWAERIRSIGKTAETVYCFFDNDHAGYAVENARTLKQMLGLS